MFQLAMTFTVAQPVVVRILMKNQVAVTRRVMHLSTKCSHTSVCVSGIASEVLLDANGCFEKAKPFLAALGGQIQQWYYVVSAINQVYADEDPRLFSLRVAANPTAPEAKKAMTPKELTMD